MANFLEVRLTLTKWVVESSRDWHTGGMGDTSDYQHLAQLVRMRRMELGLSITAAAEAAGLAKDTYKRVEAAQPIREVSYAKIDSALGFDSGSCRAVLSGADAVKVVEPQLDLRVHHLRIPPETAVRDAVAAAFIATSSSLTAAEIKALSDRVLEEFKDRGILDADSD